MRWGLLKGRRIHSHRDLVANRFSFQVSGYCIYEPKWARIRSRHKTRGKRRSFCLDLLCWCPLLILAQLCS